MKICQGRRFTPAYPLFLELRGGQGPGFPGEDNWKNVDDKECPLAVFSLRVVSSSVS